jgi:hypothetical protein
MNGLYKHKPAATSMTKQLRTRYSTTGNLLFLPSKWNPINRLIEQFLSGSSSTFRRHDNLFRRRDRLRGSGSEQYRELLSLRFDFAMQ